MKDRKLQLWAAQTTVNLAVFRMVLLGVMFFSRNIFPRQVSIVQLREVKYLPPVGGKVFQKVM